MLTSDPVKRPSAKELLRHPWFKNDEETSELSYLQNVGTKMIDF